MKKNILLLCSLCLLFACTTPDNDPDVVLPQATTNAFLDDYDAQITMSLSLSALPGVPIPHTDTIAFTIVDLGANRVRLVYTDSTTIDASITDNSLILDNDSTFVSTNGIEIKGVTTGIGTLQDSILTINGQFSGDVIGSIDMFGTLVPLTGTCTGTTVTVATKK